MNTGSVDASGTKEEALANALRLLQSDPGGAAEQAREIIAVDPGIAEAHHILAHALRRLGQADSARAAEREAIELFSLEPTLLQAAMQLADSRLDAAETLIRPHFEQKPNDPVALCLLADIGLRMGRIEAAEQFLRQAASLAPDYERPKALLAVLHGLKGRVAGANGTARGTVPVESGDEHPLASHYANALALYEIAVRRHPDRADYWVSYGHVLRAVGRRADAIAAYRESIAQQPTFGDPWWALADLKSDSFDDEDAERMLRLVDDAKADDSDRIKLHFAIARAFEQKQDFETAFRHFDLGNRMRAGEIGYVPSAVTNHVDQSIGLFDEEFFAARRDAGFAARDPIFIVGMPRAGSTLVEQILSSHPQIEATMELSDISDLAGHLAGADKGSFVDSRYLDRLSGLTAEDLRRYGQSYIWSSGLRRITDRPYFIDKMPNNWMHVGMILSILPNARIIDARRNPMDCGVSNFRQLYGQGQGFSYDLRHFGAYYADYVRLMRHFDDVIPKRIHRVIHEELIADPEPVVRGLLQYLDVPFDEACLRFYENKRVVRTASSEQVRRPLNREGVDQWKRYEARLDPLREALGTAAVSYPEVPDDLP